MSVDLDRGERFLRLMPEGQRQPVLPYWPHDTAHNDTADHSERGTIEDRRAAIHGYMAEGIAYARYFKDERPSSTAAAVQLINHYRRHIYFLYLLKRLE
ncbi:hypothetical protein R3P38DRAFT_3210721 [Favolaschia claudopus]|uniref:Uncharacterized protein n=1 Tax=Favolaschia claudopus TaxID=2862362 RepID=A0AAW0AGS3_9AGAR